MALTLKDTISWQAWVNPSAVVESLRYQRKHLLDMWANANNCKTPSEALELIILEKLSPYDSANAMIRSLQDKGLKPISIAQYRSMLGGEGDSRHGAGFFLSTLGEENFKVSTFNRLVPSGESYVSVTKKGSYR